MEGAQTPAGGRDRGDPAGEAEEAPGPPAGKRSAWNGNQQVLPNTQKKAVQSGQPFSYVSI
ncbi:hypothetical protein B4U37_16725 [Sutcliffiella horikoshii]|uniref:Uncharacterized protein n=1 Tax=Sutcliffiella horikoshii TaxID=79883 RepID=A0ABM6KMP3_9BACI|nr:hypothetical protein B4U37_16725 [Sutcliffiella horikoshii]